MFATVFGYIAGAPFILQGLFGLSAQQFGVAFSANAVGMIAMTQLNPALVRRYGPIQVVSVAVVIALASALVLLANALTGSGGLAGFMVPLAFMLAAAGLIMPNTPAIALNRHGDAAGTAAAVLGAAQFAIGGSVAPLVGVLGNGTAVPMAAILVADGRARDGAVLVRAPVAECRLGRLRFFADRGEYGSVGPGRRASRSVRGPRMSDGCRPRSANWSAVTQHSS